MTEREKYIKSVMDKKKSVPTASFYRDGNGYGNLKKLDKNQRKKVRKKALIAFLYQLECSYSCASYIGVDIAEEPRWNPQRIT